MELLSPRLGEEGRWVVVPGSVRAHPSSQLRALKRRNRMRRRRRFFSLLLWGSAITLLSALIGGPVGWPVHIAMDVLLAGYAAFLIGSRRKALERAHKVRPLRGRARREATFEFYEPVGAGRG